MNSIRLVYFIFFGITMCAWAQAKNPSSHKDLAKRSRMQAQQMVKKAEELSLLHHRNRATRLLLTGITSGRYKTADVSRLKLALTNLSEIFYQEKTQRDFELAESMPDSKLSTAVEKYKEALGLEPGNVTIMMALASVDIRGKNCATGMDLLNSALKINPYLGGLYLLKVQALRCLGDNNRSKLLLLKYSKILKPYGPYYSLINIRLLSDAHEWSDAQRKALKLEHRYNSFPDGFYWVFHLSLKLKDPQVEAGQRYLDLCQQNPDLLRKKFRLDPDVCTAQAEVKNQLKVIAQMEMKKEND